MSSSVDNRIVEMQFDNHQFERNAQTTLSTLATFGIPHCQTEVYMVIIPLPAVAAALVDISTSFRHRLQHHPASIVHLAQP